MGLSITYSTYAWSGQYVVEVSIEGRSDASLTSIETFTLSILNRGCTAGTDAGVVPDLAPDLTPDLQPDVPPQWALRPSARATILPAG